MMMEEECDCAHEQAGQRRLDSLRPTGASTCVVRVQALSLVAVRNNPSPSPETKSPEGTALGQTNILSGAFKSIIFNWSSNSSLYTALGK